LDDVSLASQVTCHSLEIVTMRHACATDASCDDP